MALLLISTSIWAQDTANDLPGPAFELPNLWFFALKILFWLLIAGLIFVTVWVLVKLMLQSQPNQSVKPINEDAEKKYPALRFIARFYKKLGVFIGCVAILAIIFSVVGLFSGNEEPFFGIILLVSVFSGPITVLSLFALSEIIMVFIDMAGNLSKIKEDMGEGLSEIKRRLADKND